MNKLSKFDKEVLGSVVVFLVIFLGVGKWIQIEYGVMAGWKFFGVAFILMLLIGVACGEDSDMP